MNLRFWSLFDKSFVRLPVWMGKIGVLVSLAGCRLYEPPRYERIQFASGAAQTRVLMIGDSLTYYNDLPGLLQQFSKGESAPVYIEQVTGPLQSLEYHWNHGDVQGTIRKGHWDYVILQDYSRRPVTDPENSIKYFALFDGEIKRAGGKTIVFQNWTRRDLEKDYEPMLQTYRQVIGQTHAMFAPIGAAWRACEEKRPDVKLLLDDRHPTEAGSYLTACVLFDVLYKGSSAKLPELASGPKVSASVIMSLREIADRSVAASPIQVRPVQR